MRNDYLPETIWSPTQAGGLLRLSWDAFTASKHNVKKAFGKDYGVLSGRRVVHLAAAIGLLIPIINVLVLKILQKFGASYSRMELFVREENAKNKSGLTFTTLSNCGAGEEPEFIFLGDIHTITPVQEFNTRVIKKLSPTENDRVFIESETPEMMLNMEYLPKNLNFTHWNVYETPPNVMTSEIASLLNFSIGHLCQRIVEVVKKIPFADDTEAKIISDAEKLYNRRNSSKMGQAYLKFLEDYDSKHSSESSYTPLQKTLLKMMTLRSAVLEANTERHSKTWGCRQEHLINSISSPSSPPVVNGGRKVIIAGKDHLILEESNDCVEPVVAKFLKERVCKYLIVFPPDSDYLDAIRYAAQQPGHTTVKGREDQEDLRKYDPELHSNITTFHLMMKKIKEAKIVLGMA